MKTDVQIAQEAKMLHILEIGKKLGLTEDDLELYGKYKAKISHEVYENLKDKKDGKLILVTAITPTPAGEGKTTVNVGLSMGLNKIGKNAITTIREASLGPCFGIKGGAAGGGYAQVVPMDDINLHFTGDIHAMTTANNLLAALVDNHIQQGNKLNIDPRRVTWKRCLDMNDRALRNIVIGLGGKTQGVPREDHFDITVASEIMAILCLATGLEDLKERLARMIVGYTYDNKPVRAEELKATGSMALLLRDAIKPNLVQTLENTPAIVHGGPFANIAHGCNSVMATKTALKLCDYVVTEAGFGADLGAEKFFDIKCRFAELKPDATVLVATIRALKCHGGVHKKELSAPNPEAVAKGLCNLEKHIENIKKYKLPVIVAVNKFPTDTDEEIKVLWDKCNELGVPVEIAEEWAKGGEGMVAMANKVVETMETTASNFEPLYGLDLTIAEKIETIAKEIYGADGVDFAPQAKKEMKRYDKIGLNNVPVCMAKTQYSLSDNQKLVGRPEGFRIVVKEIRASAGAGFLVALTGDIMTMPGLPKVPAANSIDIKADGEIVGLF